MTSEWDFAIKKYAIRDLTLEDIEEMLDKAFDLCYEIKNAYGKPGSVCGIDTFLLALKKVAAPYITVYGVDVTMNDANRVLDLCFEKEGCYFVHEGEKVCRESCFNEMFAEAIYEKFKEAGAKKFSKEGEEVLGIISRIEHGSYGTGIKNALGIPITFNVSKECATKKLGCDEYGVKMKILCNIFYNIAIGMDEDEAETRAVKKVSEECGKEKTYEVLFKK